MRGKAINKKGRITRIEKDNLEFSQKCNEVALLRSSKVGVSWLPISSETFCEVFAGVML